MPGGICKLVRHLRAHRLLNHGAMLTPAIASGLITSAKRKLGVRRFVARSGEVRLIDDDKLKCFWDKKGGKKKGVEKIIFRVYLLACAESRFLRDSCCSGTSCAYLLAPGLCRKYSSLRIHTYYRHWTWSLGSALYLMNLDWLSFNDSPCCVGDKAMLIRSGMKSLTNIRRVRLL